MSSIQVTKVHTLTGHRDCVYTVVQGADSQTIFSASGDGMVVNWNLDKPEEGELIAKLPNSVYSLYHNKKTDLLIAGQNYQGIHLLDWRNKIELASLKITSSFIFDIQQHENDLWIATGEGSVVIVDINKWTIKTKILATEKSARTIAINAQRGEVAIGYSDFCIRVFALDDYRLVNEWSAHTNSVFTLQYIPGTHFLISGSRDAKLKVWDAANQYKLVEEVAAHLYAINHIVFSPDALHFATASMDKSIKVWSASEMKLVKVIDKTRHTGHGTSVNKLVWTAYKNQLLSASDDRSISVWDVQF